jgi:hypothetical protein
MTEIRRLLAKMTTTTTAVPVNAGISLGKFG